MAKMTSAPCKHSSTDEKTWGNMIVTVCQACGTHLGARKK